MPAPDAVRVRRPDGAPAHRRRQGARRYRSPWGTDLAINLTGDPPLAERLRRQRRGPPGPFTNVARRSTPRTRNGGVPARANTWRPSSRWRPRRVRHRSSWVGTAGIMAPPPSVPEGVRRSASTGSYIADEVMAGFRPDRVMVRHQAFRRGSRSDHLRQGRHLPAAPAGRRGDQRRDLRDVRRPAYPGGLTTPTPLATACCGGDHQRAMTDREMVENAAHRPRRAGARLRELADKHPSVGEVPPGLGVFWAIELVAQPADPRTAGTLRRVQPGDGGDAGGVQIGGLLPVFELTRIHACRHCNIKRRRWPRACRSRCGADGGRQLRGLIRSLSASVRVGTRHAAIMGTAMHARSRRFSPARP